MIVKAVKKQNHIINLKYNEYLKFNNKLYGIHGNCKLIKYNKLKICKRENIIDLTNDHCINNLLQGQNARCEYSNSHHIFKVEEINPRLLLLNGFSGKLEAETSYQLNGTFLVQFQTYLLKSMARNTIILKNT